MTLKMMTVIVEKGMYNVTYNDDIYRRERHV